MKCSEIDQAMSDGTPLGELRTRPGFAGHVESCERCREIVAWVDDPLREPQLSPPLLAKIRAIVHTDLSPVRPAPSLRAAAIGAIAVAAFLLAAHAMTMGAAGWQSLSALPLYLLGIWAAAVVALGSISLLASIRPGAWQPVNPLVPISLLAAGFPAAAWMLGPMIFVDDFTIDGSRCLAVGLTVSALTAALTYSFARRGYATDWSRSGALIGALAGAVASAALLISCPEHKFSHLLLWHGLTILMSISSGFAAGKLIPAIAGRSYSK